MLYMSKRKANNELINERNLQIKRAFEYVLNNKEVIRNSIPVEKILRSYIDETVDEEVIQEIVEKEIEKEELMSFIEHGMCLSSEQKEDFSKRSHFHQIIIEFFICNMRIFLKTKNG